MKKLLMFSMMFILMGQGCLMFGTSSNPDIHKCEDNPTQEAKEGCYLSVAIHTQDRTACEKIATEVKHNQCWFEIANGTNDISYCDEIRREEDINSCITTFSNTHLQNGINDCDQHEDVDACLFHRAAARQNPIVCAASSDYDSCIASVLEGYAGDRLLCDNVTGDDQYRCAVAVGQILDDTSACESLATTDDQERCRIEAEGEYKDAAHYWGATTCIVSDPNFWNEFFDDENTTDTEAEANFLSAYGYSAFEQAEADVLKYVENDLFQAETRAYITSNCLGSFNASGVTFGDIFNIAQ